MANTTQRTDWRVIKIKDKDGGKCRYVLYLWYDNYKINKYDTTDDLQSAHIFTENNIHLRDMVAKISDMIPFAEVAIEEVDINIAIREKEDEE